MKPQDLDIDPDVIQPREVSLAGGRDHTKSGF